MTRFFQDVVCILFLALVTNACPPSKELQPCSCSDEDDPDTVICANLTDANVLRDTFQRISSYPVSNLTITDSILQFIPSNVMEQPGLTSVQVVRSYFVSLFDTTPTNAKKLTAIRIGGNSSVHRGLVFSQFKNFIALEEFYTSGTPIKKLGKAFIDNMPASMKVIYLLSAGMQQIDDFAFQKMASLRKLIIARNEIKNVKRSMFPNPSKMSTMNFNYNQIEVLPDDLFSNMPDLEFVYFMNNNLKAFSSTVFGEVWSQLQMIYVTGNPLVCDCQIKWITTRPVQFIEFWGTCADPSTLMGRQLNSLRRSDFANCND